MEATEAVVGFIGHCLEEGSDEDIRPLFRPVTSLVLMTDSLQERRVDTIMTALVNVMQLQDNYWRCTMVCIDHLLRLAKKSQLVYNWLNRNASAKVNWMLDWVISHPRAPAFNDPRLQLLKKAEHRGYGSLYNYMGLPPRTKQALLDAIREGKPIDQSNASDSDEDLSERVFEVGQWIDCRDTVNKWCEARIAAITETEVRVHYDGWTDRWDEWLDRASPRITRYGRFTSEIPRDKLKGRGPATGDNLGGGRRFQPEEFAQLRSEAAQQNYGYGGGYGNSGNYPQTYQGDRNQGGYEDVEGRVVYPNYDNNNRYEMQPF